MSTNRLVTRPQQRPDSIDEILNTLKRYDASVIKDLEDYLQDQYTTGFSDVSANLALLKLYELSDESSVEREDSTIKVLIKGLTAYDDQDFTLYLHLLPSFVLSVKTDYTTKIQQLVSLYELLAANKLDAFLAKNKEFDSIVDESNVKSIQETFNNNKDAKFIIRDVATEDVPTSKLSKIIGQKI
ncbi:CYFA0S14e03224g1_1 [Cyberlindnera fabianii]|uniref:CYFA0S14e03224g1_1 n=1 Tax=Cyberlindnera fabianii TaxID=36022 RepID=A0A061B4S0_CYBFA|nr:Eukaryotic translation initiation factor 3 subunit K [Cyberlindnera fabianii]CDR44487.1 CYFA0S14e03224g1_1 [Cyberlindnera fabianii]